MDIDDLKREYETLKAPDDMDFIIVDLYHNNQLVERNLSAAAVSRLIRKLTGGSMLVLACRKMEQVWIELHPDTNMYTTKSAFLHDQYTEALNLHHRRVNKLFDRLKARLLEHHHVDISSKERVLAAQKCWDLSCVHAVHAGTPKSKTFDQIVKRFDDYSILLTP